MHDVVMCMSQIRHNDLQTCRHTSTEEHKALQASASFVCLCFVSTTTSILNLFNLDIISYSLPERPVMEMINTMLHDAFSVLGPENTPLLHTDQGWQYRMAGYQAKLKAHGMTQSTSRKGNCLDNAVMENFFGTLKSECFYLNRFSDLNELRKAIEDYIHYYNNERISLKLKGLSPVEYRTQALKAA